MPINALRPDESVQHDRAEDNRYCWFFFNTYRETCTFSQFEDGCPIFRCKHRAPQRLWIYTALRLLLRLLSGFRTAIWMSFR